MPHLPPTGRTRIIISHADYDRMSDSFRAHMAVDDPQAVCAVCMCADCKIFRDLITSATYLEAVDNIMMKAHREKGRMAVEAMQRSNRRNRYYG